LFNSGVFNRLPSLTTESSTALVMGWGLFAIATYWAALTSGWLLLSLYRQSETPAEFKRRVLIWSLFLGPLGLWVAWKGGWYCAGLGGAIWLMPLLQVAHFLTLEPVKKPTYSRAVARMHFDKYEEAEVAVIQELEKFEEDFDGWMLLAELYAVHFHDLAEADRTIRETCAHSATTDSQRSVALHKLADWHLKLANDPVAARRGLDELCRIVPNSHLAHMARARLKQLPATKEEWIEQQKARTYHLPALRSDFDPASPGAAISGPAASEALSRARRLAEKLHQNPNDASHREELARLLAEKIGKVDAGLEQVELLLTLPEQPEQKRAEWLALIASWRLQLKGDEPAAREVLERLIHQFPRAAQAFAAQRRLNLLDLEAKLRANTSTPKPPKISYLPS
jgi:hypothetical protein